MNISGGSKVLRSSLRSETVIFIYWSNLLNVFECGVIYKQAAACSRTRMKAAPRKYMR